MYIFEERTYFKCFHEIILPTFHTARDSVWTHKTPSLLCIKDRRLGQWRFFPPPFLVPHQRPQDETPSVHVVYRTEFASSKIRKALVNACQDDRLSYRSVEPAHMPSRTRFRLWLVYLVSAVQRHHSIDEQFICKRTEGSTHSSRRICFASSTALVGYIPLCKGRNLAIQPG
jgi:hypothetical protein